MLRREQWETIARRPKFIADNQVFDFAYYIGNHRNEVTVKDGIKTYSYYGNNSNADNITPNEFIWMISHCRQLKTSSFHGAAFGAIF